MNAVKARREALGLSAAQLARMVGCSVTLIDIVEGGHVIHPAFADRIAEKLKLSEAERDAMVAARHRGDGAEEGTEEGTGTASARETAQCAVSSELGPRQAQEQGTGMAGATKCTKADEKASAKAAKVPVKAGKCTKKDDSIEEGAMGVAVRLRGNAAMLDAAATVLESMLESAQTVRDNLTLALNIARALADDWRRMADGGMPVGIPADAPEPAADDWRRMADGGVPAGIPADAPKPAADAAPRPGNRMGKKPREVVKLNADGEELGRWKGAKEAAGAAGMSERSVSDRCRRKIEREFMRMGGRGLEVCTWRWAAEWDAMSPAERRLDMRGEYKP